MPRSADEPAKSSAASSVDGATHETHSATTSVDILGVERGPCGRTACAERCARFRRPMGVTRPLTAAVLRCLDCGCASGAHARIISPEPTSDCGPPTGAHAGVGLCAFAPSSLPSTGTHFGAVPCSPDSGSGPSTDDTPQPATQNATDTTAEAERQADVSIEFVPPTFVWSIDTGEKRVKVGDMVRLRATNCTAGACGVVCELFQGPDVPPSCRVELLDGMGDDASLEVPISGVEIVNGVDHESGAHGETICDFEQEGQFPRLVFQASCLRPLASALRQRKCKLCVLGGSISLQKAGYRPQLVQALERRGVQVEDLPAAVGTAGSKALSLVVGDWVIQKKPDLLIIEVAVNDGDELLEGTPHPDIRGILRAAEGIVRTVRRRSPDTSIVFLEMLLRDDVGDARVLKTGAEAWRDSDTQAAVGWYHQVAPLLHRHLCCHYGLAHIDLIPALRSLTVEERNSWFRDDCHHSEFGGDKLGRLIARLLLWAVRQPAMPPRNGLCVGLPPALDSRCWCNGQTLRISPRWLTPAEAIATVTEADPLQLMGQADWLLLGAGGKATIPFQGRACGIITLLGPDAPTVHVRVDGGPAKQLHLLDRWCYYWRTAVVLLCEDLEDVGHMLVVSVDPTPPSHSILKRSPTAPQWDHFRKLAEQGARPVQRLWLLHACIVEGAKVER